MEIWTKPSTNFNLTYSFSLLFIFKNERNIMGFLNSNKKRKFYELHSFNFTLKNYINWNFAKQKSQRKRKLLSLFLVILIIIIINKKK